MKRRWLSLDGAEFIARYEGYRARAYADANGDATIGYGHRMHEGPPTAKDKLKWVGRDVALSLLRADAQKAADAIVELVQVELPQSKFDALVSFVYNVGIGNFARSHLLKDINAHLGDAAVAFELERWIRGDHGVLPGLVTRRRAELRLWLHGRYQ